MVSLDRMQSLTAEEMVDLSSEYTLWSWSAQKAVKPIPMVKGQGVYFWDANGKRYLDFNSQLMCVNIGHGDRRVIEAIQRQAEELVYAGPGMATRVRAEFGPLLARHTPGNLNKFFFTLGGAEANENAIKLARFYTGRHKIITRYRSYHGATQGAVALTGDPRRWPNEPGMPGVIRVMDAFKYRSLLYREGDSDEVFSQKLLDQIEEVVLFEGPQSIAAVFIETVTGTNGLIVPPDGYLQGLRALCDKYGILLICDEVMCGLGRTGEWFAVDHWGVVPDMITMAKGLTSAYLPLGCVAMKEEIARHFDDRVLATGLTYNGHPMCLAAAVANLKVLEEDDLIGNSKRMGKVMAGLLDDLKAEHPSVGDVRSIGLFGLVELVKNRQTKEPMAPFNATSEPMQKLGGAFKASGLYTFVFANTFFTNPPLCITEEELREGFEVINEALAITDQAIVK